MATFQEELIDSVASSIEDKSRFVSIGRDRERIVGQLKNALYHLVGRARLSRRNWTMLADAVMNAYRCGLLDEIVHSPETE